MRRLTLLLFVLTLAACEPAPETDPAPDAEASTETASAPEVTMLTSTVLVDYEGRLQDGTVFDSGERVEFRLPELIDGVRDRMAGMRAGESKTFTVPPEEGYGPNGIPGLIPPGEDITFEVTVHEILN